MSALRQTPPAKQILEALKKRAAKNPEQAIIPLSPMPSKWEHLVGTPYRYASYLGVVKNRAPKRNKSFDLPPYTYYLGGDDGYRNLGYVDGAVLADQPDGEAEALRLITAMLEGQP